jgi:hypothetical protein
MEAVHAQGQRVARPERTAHSPVRNVRPPLGHISVLSMMAIDMICRNVILDQNNATIKAGHSGAGGTPSGKRCKVRILLQHNAVPRQDQRQCGIPNASAGR